TRQDVQQRSNQQHDDRARVRARREIDDLGEAGRGLELTPLVVGRNGHSRSVLVQRRDNRETAARGEGRENARYCNRTSTLSVEPAESITVSRTKPGPSGSKNTVFRRPAGESSGAPLTSTVTGPTPPEIRIATGSGRPSPPLASSSRAPFGG